MPNPSCAPAWAYVPIPEGSSSEAPVMSPGPRLRNTRGTPAPAGAPRRRFSAATVTSSPRVEPQGKARTACRCRRAGESRASPEYAHAGATFSAAGEARPSRSLARTCGTGKTPRCPLRLRSAARCDALALRLCCRAWASATQLSELAAERPPRLKSTFRLPGADQGRAA
jgi:hypothetical protein